MQEGCRSASVYKFCKKLGIREKEFYEQFNSFYALDKEIWKNFIHRTVKQIESEKVYHDYSVREKLLAFYFTLVELLKENRSFVYYLNEADKGCTIKPKYLSGAKKAFIDYVRVLILKGRDTKEIVSRPILTDRYADILWIQFMFLIRFWLKDESEGFEKTDEAIEKAVNLSFDIMGKWPLDSMIGFAKFFIQSKA